MCGETIRRLAALKGDDHIANRGFDAAHQGAGHQAVADDAGFDLLQWAQGAAGLIVQAIAGQHAQLEAMGHFGGIHDPGEHAPARGRGGMAGVYTGVDLDAVGVQPVGRLDVLRLRVDEEKDRNAAVADGGDRIRDFGAIQNQVQAAFGGGTRDAFVASFVLSFVDNSSQFDKAYDKARDKEGMGC